MIEASATTSASFIVLIFVLIGICVYFIPSFVAVTRKVTNTGSVFVINLLLGWTLVGWAVALAMAVKTNMTQIEVVTRSADTAASQSKPPAAQPTPTSALSNAPGSKRCSRCDQKLDDNATICSRCGLSMLSNADEAKISSQSDQGIMWCDACDMELDADDKYCRKCGSPAQVLSLNECIECHTAIDAEDKFCRSCGTSLS
jgi:RNA polymerase subunit RPABC4/transcription elongation factor Spt4